MLLSPRPVLTAKNSYSHSALVSPEKGIVNIMSAEVFSCHPCVWYTYPVMVWWLSIHRSDGGEKRWREGKEGRKNHHSSPAFGARCHTNVKALGQEGWNPAMSSKVRRTSQGLSQVKESNHTNSLWWESNCGSSSSTSNTFLFLPSDKVTQSKNLVTWNRVRQVTEYLAISWPLRCLCVYLVYLARASKEFCWHWKSKYHLYIPDWTALWVVQPSLSPG